MFPVDESLTLPAKFAMAAATPKFASAIPDSVQEKWGASSKGKC